MEDGTVDDRAAVFWLQTAHAMADVRIDGDRPPFDGVHSLAECSDGHLAALATANASTGHTSVEHVVDHPDGSHTCVAQWHTYGHGANFQPVVTYPEPGLLHVDATGTVMTERAPSGAYVEEWHLVPGSRDVLRSEPPVDGREWFRAGPVVIVVRDRAVAPPRDASLSDLIAHDHLARATIEALLDTEYSVAFREPDGRTVVRHSTLPWLEGTALDVTA
ncbi:MAG: hypothetical protein RL238_301 [Actinomycetota bacterium]